MFRRSNLLSPISICQVGRDSEQWEGCTARGRSHFEKYISDWGANFQKRNLQFTIAIRPKDGHRHFVQPYITKCVYFIKTMLLHTFEISCHILNGTCDYLRDNLPSLVRVSQYVERTNFYAGKGLLQIELREFPYVKYGVSMMWHDISNVCNH